MKTTDLQYIDDGLFTRFIPHTPCGERIYNELAKQNDGCAVIFTMHADAVIRQIRQAGYSVSKARQVAIDDIRTDQLLAELGI